MWLPHPHQLLFLSIFMPTPTHSTPPFLLLLCTELVELALPLPQPTVPEPCNRWNRDKGTQTNLLLCFDKKHYNRERINGSHMLHVLHIYYKSVWKETEVCKSSETWHNICMLCEGLYMCTCLPRAPLPSECSARLQCLQQAIHDTSFITLCKHNIIYIN